jgi:TonB family protein
MRLLTIIGAAGLLLFAPAHAADTAPDWAARPAGDPSQPAYPALARQFSVEGYARLTCKVGLDGAARACAIAAEAPTGLGFGPAALALAPTFKLKPGLTNGAPVDNAPVSIPVRFKPASLPLPSAEARPTPTASAIAAARRVMAAQTTESYLYNRFGQLMIGLTIGPFEGVDRQTSELGLHLVTMAIRQAIPPHLEASAQIYASYQSSEALEANARFGESKAGAAYRALTPKLGPYEDTLARNAMEGIVATAVCPPASLCAPPPPSSFSPVVIAQPTPTAMNLATQIAAVDLPLTPIPPGRLKMLIGGATKLSDTELQALATHQWTRIQGLAAEAYAHNLDEDQLRDVLAFKSSPAGQALRQSSPALSGAMRQLERQSMQGVLKAAAAEFCRQRTCQISDLPPAGTKELEALVITASPLGL